MTEFNDRELLEIIAQYGQKTYQKVELLDQRVERLEEKVDKLEEKVDKLDQRMERIEQRVDRLEEKVEENHEMLVTLTEDFRSFKEIVNEHEFSIRLLKRKVGS